MIKRGVMTLCLGLSSAMAMADLAMTQTIAKLEPAVQSQSDTKGQAVLRFKSADDVATTQQKIQQILTEKGMKIFAVIDHQQAAKEAGLDMQAATVIIFGTPKAGTPLMVKDPDFALQLPLKVLVTEVDGQVYVVLNRTERLIQASRIEMADVAQNLAKVETLFATLFTAP